MHVLAAAELLLAVYLLHCVSVVPSYDWKLGFAVSAAVRLIGGTLVIHS